MFDSPFTYCPMCGEMVLLDQTWRECAAEHCCGDGKCPLAEVFNGIDFEETKSCPEPKHERCQ